LIKSLQKFQNYSSSGMTDVTSSDSWFLMEWTRDQLTHAIYKVMVHLLQH